MIHVLRTPQAPGSLVSKAAATERARATRFFKRSPSERRQELHEFGGEIYADDDVHAALRDLFHDKCAYCESPPGELQAPIVDHFRPPAGALDLDGSYHPDHYWWLAYEWENLYLVCPDCSQMKGTRFPVAAERAAPRLRGDELWAEQAKLIDPCTDDPETHLVYSVDGYVSSGTERGKVTIEVLALNRWWLVMARGDALKAARAEWAELKPQVAAKGTRARRAIERFMSSAQPYAALRRQFARQWLSEGEATPKMLGEATTGSGGKVGVVDQRQREVTRQIFNEFEENAQHFSVAWPAKRAEQYFISSRTISRVEIRNFRIIRELTLDFPTTPAPIAPWLVLLGENGSGKSSILQAVTLALMGDEYRRKLQMDPRRIVRRGCSRGSVVVHLTGSSEPIELTFNTRSHEFKCVPGEPKVLLLGYGATRLLPRPDQRPGKGGSAARNARRFANVDNLFNPFVALKDPAPFLVSLDDERFDSVGRALRKLLPMSNKDRFMRTKHGVEVRAFGAQLQLSELSDGYQSVIALATDAMQVLMHRWPAMEVAEGIVAIDEVEAHLHPCWRMRIVSSLRDVFPRIQFLATTHDPLCLRGLQEGEVVVMQRNAENDVFALTDLPKIQGLRVDQLLTSEIFGLNSTTDPEVDELLREYRELRWRGDDSAAARRRREELSKRLDELLVLGRDRRERLVLEAADDYLGAEAHTADGEQRRKLKASTKKRIAKIFAEAVPKEARRS